MFEITSERVLRAVCRHVDWRQGTLVPEAVVRYLEPDRAANRFVQRHYMADLMWVTENALATEIEIKVSRADWRVDLEKGKWGLMPRWVSRFVYAVPEELGLPEWVPEAAGVWHVRDTAGSRLPEVRMVRAPRRLGGETVPPALLRVWRAELYYKYWLRRLYEDNRLPAPTMHA